MKLSVEQAGSIGVGVGLSVATGFGLMTILRSSPFDSPYSESPKCCA